eukprot:126331_1
MIKNKLEKSLRHREEEKDDKTVFHRRRAYSFDEDKLAPTLQSIANRLSMEQKKNTLKDQLSNRSDAKELISNNILKPYAKSLAMRLQLNADLLEKQLAIRVNVDHLKDLGILDPYKKNVDTTPISVEETSNLLLKSLAFRLSNRSRAYSGDNELIAPSLQATAKKLETSQKKDIVSSTLKSRTDAESHGVDTKMAPSLQATKKKLETAQKKDIISSTLNTRSDAKSHGVDTKISPAIQSIAASLKSSMRKDSISKGLASRSDVSELVDSGILKPYCKSLAKSLQYDANKLEEALANQVSKEYLQEIGILDPYKKNVDSNNLNVEEASSKLLRALVYRSTPRGVLNKQSSAFGFSSSDISPSIQDTAHNLEVQQKKDKLSSALQNRPTSDTVLQAQSGSLGYEIKAAGSLQQTIKIWAVK